jgi:CHRD domain-containing protein
MFARAPFLEHVGRPQKESAMRRIAPRAAAVVIAIVVGTIGLATVAGTAGKQNVKSDEMIGYQEVPGVSSNASGNFTAEIDDDAQQINFELTYTGLSGPAAFAHIHFGMRSANGGVAVFFCGGGGKPICPPGTTDQATVTGTIVPADVIGPATQGIAAGEFDELVQAIRAGMTYANVHTTAFPGGEIRGQVNDRNQRQP